MYRTVGLCLKKEHHYIIMVSDLRVLVVLVHPVGHFHNHFADLQHCKDDDPGLDQGPVKVSLPQQR